MSAYNTLQTNVQCPSCKNTSNIEVQFKYGDTWQYSYRLEDHINWGGNDIGERTNQCITIDGIAGPCPFCNLDFIEVLIHIDNNIIKKVTETVFKEQQTTPAEGSFNTLPKRAI